MSTQVFKKRPGVLSFQRGIVISDAMFYNEIEGDFEPHPVFVIRHGTLGTQNVDLDGDADARVAAKKQGRDPRNPQRTDSAKLSPDASALVVRFSLRFLDLSMALSACAPDPKKDKDEDIAAYRESVNRFVERAKISSGIAEIARRYARNIANGRWLWRNRLIARSVAVTVNHRGEKLAEFDALRTPINHFDDIPDAENRVAAPIAEGLRGDSGATLEILARVEFGAKGAIEVFPSQNYIEDKPRGFARSLYCLGEPERADRTLGMRRMGHAALRDQKVSNALRTIDTWYPDFAAFQRPIPVEPNGANLEAQRFFRDGKKVSAFDLVKRLNQLDPATPDGLFVIASLIRGGVFSEGAK